MGHNKFHVANLLQETNSALQTLMAQTEDDCMHLANLLQTNYRLQQQLDQANAKNVESNDKIAELANTLHDITKKWRSQM